MTSGDFQNLVFANVFQGIRQLRDEGVYDLTVVVCGIGFRCHRLILASVSKYFRKKIKPTSKRVRINDPDVRPDSFEFLLGVLYNGKEINETEIQDFWKMSLFLEIDFLAEECERIVSSDLRPEVCVAVWQISQKYNRHDLADKSRKMAVENIDAVTDQLLKLPKSMLLILLSLQQKLDMDGVCKTILSWVKDDHRKRLIHLTELLLFISFPLLTSSYLSDLIAQDYQQFGDVFEERIQEAQKIHLKNLRTLDVKGFTQILARQPTRLNLPEIRSRAVVVSQEHVLTFDLQADKLEQYALTRAPQPINVHFGSCVWQNEIYLCGGSFFGVYKPGDNRWEVLHELPVEGRERHAMAAVSSKIYVLGGVNGNATRVCKYDIQSREWSGLPCPLLSPVQDASAAVLGHRIYLFGGADGNGRKTNLVQCLDTLRNVSYIAGTLPSPACSLRAVSNGGIIYVVLPSGEVLQMMENFYLADKTEKTLASKTKRGENSELANHKTIKFKKIKKIHPRHCFGVCLDKDDLFVYGGQSERGKRCKTLRINIASGEVKTTKLTPMDGGSYFDLHIVNVPQVHILTNQKAVQDTTGRRDFGTEVHSQFPEVPGPSRQPVPKAAPSPGRPHTTGGTDGSRQTTGVPSTTRQSHSVAGGSHSSRPQGEKRPHSSEQTRTTGGEKQATLSAVQETTKPRHVVTAPQSTVSPAVPGTSRQQPSQGGLHSSDGTEPSQGRAHTSGGTEPSQGRAHTSGGTEPSQGRAHTSGGTDRSRQTTGVPSTTRQAHSVAGGSHSSRPQGEKRRHSSEQTRTTGGEKHARYTGNSDTDDVPLATDLEIAIKEEP